MSIKEKKGPDFKIIPNFSTLTKKKGPKKAQSDVNDEAEL